MSQNPAVKDKFVELRVAFCAKFPFRRRGIFGYQGLHFQIRMAHQHIVWKKLDNPSWRIDLIVDALGLIGIDRLYTSAVFFQKVPVIN